MTPDGLMSALVAVALVAVLLAVLRGFSYEHECGSPLTVKQLEPHVGRSPESENGSGDLPGDPDVDGPSYSSEEETVLAIYLVKRWRDDLLLHDRFETVADYVQHVDRMFIGLCRFEPALLPPDAMSRRQPEET